MINNELFGLFLMLILALIAVLTAIFVIGRSDYWRRITTKERSIDELEKLLEEKHIRLESLRKSIQEEEQGKMEHLDTLQKKELRAREAIERWETVRQDHQNLERMKRELEEFEREESRRIDDLGIKREEAARRLDDIQSALDQYPSEIIEAKEDWKEYLEKRKKEHDELRTAMEQLKARREQIGKEWSERINGLELKRAEAAHRLDDIRSALGKYPPEIAAPEADWKGYLERRKQEHDEMKTAMERLEDQKKLFEKEELKKITELEVRRAEAARRLDEIQSILGSKYPPEIAAPEADWKEYLEKRKKEFDELETDVKGKKSWRDQLYREIQELEEERNRLQHSLDKTKQDLGGAKKSLAETKQKHEAIEAVTRTIEKTEIQFPDHSLNVAVKEVPGKTDPKDKLSMFKSPPDCLVKQFEEASEEKKEDTMLSEFMSGLEKQNLYYPKRIIRAFHTALKVNDLSPLTVLSGLSGTGKSQLPRAYARFFGIHFLHVPVEPGWDSPQDLLGFYDFVAERYRPTDRARALGHFDKDFMEDIGIKNENDRDWRKRMLIILLDEMNLARTEYYFSEFLSRLEMRGTREISDDDASSDNHHDSRIAIDMPYAEEEEPKHLHIPHNVLWVGTLNEDETTQALSDKVLDRANSIRFAPPKPDALCKHSKPPERDFRPSEGYLPYERWLSWSDITKTKGDNKVDETLKQLADLMQNAGRGFGYRIAQSIKAYIDRYPGKDWREPMIDQINMRLLPKLAGAEMHDCNEQIEGLLTLTEDDLDDSSFAETLREALKSSQTTQIFNWPGYTYEERSEK